MVLTAHLCITLHKVSNYEIKGIIENPTLAQIIVGGPLDLH